MLVRIELLNIGRDIRLVDEPIDMSAGQRTPIDILRDGTVLDGHRRIGGMMKIGKMYINARVWPTEDQFRVFKSLEFGALQRSMSVHGEFGESD